eukprot:scpid35626/ scgid17268/ 
MDDLVVAKRSRVRQLRSRRSMSLDECNMEAPPPSPEPERSRAIVEEPMINSECQNELVNSLERMEIFDPHKLRESLELALSGELHRVDENIPRVHSAPMSMPGITTPERMGLDLHLPSIDSSTESSPPIQSSPACSRDYSDFRSRNVFDNCRSLPASISFLAGLDPSMPYRERSSSLKRMRDDSCADDLDGHELGCSVPKRCRLLSNDFCHPSSVDDPLYSSSSSYSPRSLILQ